MATVHVFVANERFRSFEEMRAFIDETYTDDDDGIASLFMKEVQLSGYEPGCIEAIYLSQPLPLSQLLIGVSYADQWLHFLDCSLRANAAICVFEPTIVRCPNACSLDYCGAFEYQIVHPDWLQRLLRGEQ